MLINYHLHDKYESDVDEWQIIDDEQWNIRAMTKNTIMMVMMIVIKMI